MKREIPAGYAVSERSVAHPWALRARLYVPDGPATRALLVCLHRYGGNPDSFARIVPWLDLAGFAFLFPRGPFRVLSPKGQVQYAWAVSTPFEPDADGRDFSLNAVAACIAEAAEALGAAPLTLFLLGHSQGGYLALHLLLRFPERFRAGAAFGAQMNANLAAAERRAPPGCSALLLHGERDRLVGIEKSEEAARLLADRGISAEVRRYPDLGHWLTREAYRDAADWIRRLTPTR